MFETLNCNRFILPTIFDYDFFFKTVLMIFEQQDHFLNIAKTIQILYKHFELLSYEFQNKICLYFLNEQFFQFFLSWSYVVRLAFHYFLVFIVYDKHRILKTNLTDIKEIKNMINTNLHVQKNSQEQEQINRNLMNDYIYYKYYHLIKMIEKKVKKENEKKREDYNQCCSRLVAKQ